MQFNVYRLLKAFQESLAIPAWQRGPFALTIFSTTVRAAMLITTSWGMVQAAAPVVNAPATQNVGRETYLVFNATNGNLISITDADNHNQTVTITVTNGSFFLEDVTGLTPVAPATFTGTGQQEITVGTPVSFSGTLANVNAALSESSFYPTNGYAGPASVQIATNDGAGGNDSETINITVLAGTDTDGDGIYDHKDLDDDNDGIPDNVENPCEKLFTFDLSSEGWFTINDNNGNKRSSNAIETPASHSTDGRTQNVRDNSEPLPGCPIDNTGRANKNIAGASPTRTAYIVDTDPSGGLMYLRSPNLGGINYSNLLGGTFQYDAYNYRVNKSGDPGWLTADNANKARATVYIFNTQGKYVRAQSDLAQNPHFNRFQAGLWNTFTFSLNATTWTGDASLADVLADVDQISIRMEYIGGGNTNKCNDVEYYAMDNVVLTAQASCDDDVDNDGIPNYLDLDSDGDGTFDAVEAGHGQPHTNGVVNGPVGTDGIPDAVQGPGNGNSGGAQYPPILDLNGSDGAASTDNTITFTEDGGAVAIADASATLYDGNDADNLARLTVVLTNRPDGTAELLSVNGSLLGGITAGAYDPANGTLVLSGNASVTNYLDALKKIIYNNSSQNPDGTATRAITVVVSDGKADSNTGTTTITVNPANDPPTAADKTLTTDEDVAKVMTPADLGYSDPENNALSMITLTAVPGLTKGTLFVDEDKSGRLDNGEVALTINDAVTKAQLDDGKLTFSPAANAFGSAHASFSFKANDGSVDAVAANTITFDVNPVNDAPVNNLPVAQSVKANNTLVLSGFDALSVGDDARSNPIEVMLSVTNGTINIPADPNNIVTGNGTTTVTLTGTVTQINTALDGLEYTGNLNYSGAEQLTITTNDQGNTGTGSPLADTDQLAITVTPPNEAPVVLLNGTDNAEYAATFTEDGGPVAVADVSAATLTDADHTSLTALTVTVTNVADVGKELLTVVGLPASLSSNYNPTTGILEIANADASNPGSVADYQTALRGLRYENISQNPLATTRLIRVVATDGIDNSPVAETAMNVAPQNDTPLVNVPDDGTNPQSTDEDIPLTFNTAGGNLISISDADGDNQTITITVTSGTFKLSGDNGLTGLSGDGTAAVSFIGSLIDVNDALENATFMPDAAFSGTATITIKSDDGNATDTQSFIVTLNATNDAPTADNAEVATYVDEAYTFVDTDFSADYADEEANDFAGIKITGAATAGTLTLGGNAVTIGQTITLAELSGGDLAFTPAAGATGNPHATFTFQVIDSEGASSADYTLSVVVKARPTTADATLTAQEDTELLLTDADFAFSDPDAVPDAFAGVIITQLPHQGTLSYDGTAVTATDLTSGTLFTDRSKFTYAAALNGNGSRYTTIGFRVQDAAGDESVPHTLTVDVSAVNDAPVVSNVPKASAEGDTVRFAAADFTAAYADVDTDPLQTVKITSLPPVASGMLFLDGVAVAIGDEIAAADLEKLTFVPTLGFAGTATFGWNGFDGTAYAADESTVTLTINAAPDVTPMPLTVTTGTTYFGTLADQVADAEGHTLTFSTTPTTDVAHGTLTLNEDGSFIYVPEVGYTGEDSFTYTVCDDGSPSACTTGIATLTVSTTEAPDSDNDGIPDAVEKGSDPNNPTDSDGDGTPDYQDTDSDNDGIPDATEAGSDSTTPQDTDGDGIPDHLDQDADGDGIDDATEVGDDPANPTDSDNDGTPDYRDPDNSPVPPEDDLVIYEGFSPNDDNTNETWQIAGIENYPNNTVQIYNRWGNLLFEVQGYNNQDKAWGSDSSVGLILGSKNVPDGTYFYLIDLGDGSPIRKGYITVHR
jgi:gliding motility-associated-like protein